MPQSPPPSRPALELALTQAELRQAQPGAGRAYARVAAHGHLQAAAQCHAVDGSHSRLRTALEEGAEGVIDLKASWGRSTWTSWAGGDTGSSCMHGELRVKLRGRWA